MASTPFRIDLNADVGEGIDADSANRDEALLNLVTSVNIACGFHAGDPATMRRLVGLANQRGVAIGAHPGLLDRAHFGRRECPLGSQEAYEIVLYQLGALEGFARASGASLSHVKPHGALYNMAARDCELAAAIAKAVHDFDPRLALFGLAGSQLIVAAQQRGLPAVREAFVDRSYECNGQLTPRELHSAAVHSSIAQICEQAISLARNQRVTTRTGRQISVVADTLCLHGDRADAVAVARAVRQCLAESGIALAPFSDIRSSAAATSRRTDPADATAPDVSLD